MDSNLHLSMWKPRTYTHTQKEADDLTSLMNNYRLLIQSGARVLTFISYHRHGGKTTVDLQWSTPEF